MRPILALLLFTMIPVSASGQIAATTEDGRRVLLYEDGSWAYAEAETSTITYIHTGDGNRLKAAAREEVADEIELQVAVENGAPRLVIWKKTPGDCQARRVIAEFFGEASLLLENAAIPLVDRGETGRQTVTEESGYSRSLARSSAQRYCETWGMYHLTRTELRKIEENPLSKLRIEWESRVRSQSEILHVNENRWTLRRQIEALDL